MRKILLNLVDCALNNFRTRAALKIEIIILRHQLEVLQRTRPARVRLTRLDQILWVALYRFWPRSLDAHVIVKPATAIAWHHKGFRAFWAWKSRPRRRGRPPVPAVVRALIGRVTRENPLWDAPRVHVELLKLGIEISQAAVSKYMIRHPKPPSQTWRTFLRNHVRCLASVDFFVVPTAMFRPYMSIRECPVGPSMTIRPFRVTAAGHRTLPEKAIPPLPQWSRPKPDHHGTTKSLIGGCGAKTIQMN